MTYAHHWTVDEQLSPFKWQTFQKDVQAVFTYCDKIGLDLAGENGEGKPSVTHFAVRLNGRRYCRHKPRQLGQLWPTPEAHGVAVMVEEGLPVLDATHTLQGVLSVAGVQFAQDSDTEGLWPGGVRVNARTCGGDCSYEAFTLLQSYAHDTLRWRKEGRVVDHCATNFHPYDIAVTAILLLARHHFGDAITIESDGLAQHWVDAAAMLKYLFPEYSLTEANT